MDNIKDVMIDLETVGNKPGCPIVSIGACVFDMNTNRRFGTFDGVLDIQAQLDKGLKMDASTIQWWMGQSDEARQLFKKEGKDPVFVLETFSKWLKSQAGGGSNNFYVWGNGSSFDISILEYVYNSFGLDVPWRYNRVMDLRTYKRLVAGGAQIPRLKGTHHDALDDAVNQMEYVLAHNKRKKK